MNIALVSLNQVWEDKLSNLAECKTYIEIASTQNVNLIVFPEMTLTGFSTNINEIFEEEKNSQTILAFMTLAKQYSIAIIFGVVVKDKKNVFNRLYFIDNEGEILGKYSKIHPFRFAGEDQYFCAGNNISMVDFQGYKFGLTICYDLRFSNLYDRLEKEGADVIVNIANWPKKRIDHWNTLLKARAIENQLYVIGVNRIGSDGNSLEYEESSNIFNANGDNVSIVSCYNNMKIINIDKKFTDDFKKNFNTVQDKKISYA